MSMERAEIHFKEILAKRDVLKGHTWILLEEQIESAQLIDELIELSDRLLESNRRLVEICADLGGMYGRLIAAIDPVIAESEGHPQLIFRF